MKTLCVIFQQYSILISSFFVVLIELWYLSHAHMLQHGADGIDDKPVPQDLWGLRGALQGARGMPHVPERIETQTTRGISNDPFPGLDRGGKVERSVFRRHVEAWCPTHRFQERSCSQ
jgi:hypothetical protein